MADSPGSPLSSHASSEFTEDIRIDEQEAGDYPDGPYTSGYSTMPSAKRQKTGASSYRSTPQYDNGDGDISSDTSGSAPSSPVANSALVHDDDHGEQVTVCRWRNCDAGDLGNMDELVQHINTRHIENNPAQKQKKFVCEWEGCPRQDISGASAYALRSHMRSHTREKPFVCVLPECDKSFTRSDAQAKHMRTVHETEALRPSDPIPRGHPQAQLRPQKLKLTFKKGHGAENGTEIDEDTLLGDGDAPPPDLKFTDEEWAMRPDLLFKLCRRQLHWSGQEGDRLKDECAELEEEFRREWYSKELVLANVVEAELGATIHEQQSEEGHVVEMVKHLLPNKMLPLSGQQPWYRAPINEQR